MKYKITDLMDLYEDQNCPLAPLDKNMKKKESDKEIIEVKASKHALTWTQGLGIAASVALLVLSGFGVKTLLNRTQPGNPGTSPISSSMTTTEEQISLSELVETSSAEPEPSEVPQIFGGLIGEMISDEGNHTISFDIGNEDPYVQTTPYSYHIPSIQADTEGAKAINQDIDAFFGERYREQAAEMEAGYSVTIYEIGYNYTDWNGILSLIVHACYPNDYTISNVYNYEISTGRWLNTLELLERMQIDEDDFVQACEAQFQALDQKEGLASEYFFQDGLLLQDGNYYRQKGDSIAIQNENGEGDQRSTQASEANVNPIYMIHSYPASDGQLTILSMILSNVGAATYERIIPLGLYAGEASPAQTSSETDALEEAITALDVNLPEDYFLKLIVGDQPYFANTHCVVWEENNSVFQKDLASGQTVTLHTFDADSGIETTLLGVTVKRLYYGWKDSEFAPGSYFVYSVDYDHQDRVDYRNQDLAEYGNGLQVVDFKDGRIILKSWSSDDRPVALCVIDRDDQVILQSKESYGGVQVDGDYYFICAEEPLLEEAFLSDSAELLNQVKYEVYRMNPAGEIQSIGTLEGYVFYGITSEGRIFCDYGPMEDGVSAVLDLYTLEPIDSAPAE